MRRAALQTLALHGTRSAVPLRLARRLWETEHYYQAMNEWRSVLGQDPGNLEARLGLARAAAKAGGPGCRRAGVPRHSPDRAGSAGGPAGAGPPGARRGPLDMGAAGRHLGDVRGLRVSADSSNRLRSHGLTTNEQWGPVAT